MTFYDVLGVAETASADDIKTAYRRLAMEFHPDRTPGANKAVQRLIEDKFKEVQEAYDTLKDRAKRAEYDAALAMLCSEEYYEPAPQPSPPPRPTPPSTQRPTPPQKPKPPTSTRASFLSVLWMVWLFCMMWGGVDAALSYLFKNKGDAADFIISSFLITGAPIALWICVVKVKMKWPIPAFLPSAFMLLLAVIAITAERVVIRPAKAVQPQTLETARTEMQTPIPNTSPQLGNQSTQGSEKEADVDKSFANFLMQQTIINLGNALRDKGDFDGAIAKYRQALRLRPADGELHSNLGWVFEQKGDLENATTEYDAAIRINPLDNFSRAGLSRIKDKRAAPQQTAGASEHLTDTPPIWGNATITKQLLVWEKTNIAPISSEPNGKGKIVGHVYASERVLVLRKIPYSYLIETQDGKRGWIAIFYTETDREFPLSKESQ